jgi:hypothetical protein
MVTGLLVTVVFLCVLAAFASFTCLAVMNQRKQLRWERARFAHLKRITSGGRIRR